MKYQTIDEINFIADLKQRPNRTICLQYCMLVLTLDRRWDPGVNVSEVREAARQAIREITYGKRRGA